MDCRRSYADDPALCDRVFDLLGTWLPGLPAQRRRAERLRWRWEDCSTPFVIEEGDRVVCHVGLLEMPLQVCGRPVLAGGLHAVCTLAERRRKGLYRRVMEEVLAYCAGRYETLVLSTEQPELYLPFGFRVVREQRFAAPGPSERPGGPDAELRPLAPADARDLDTLERLLATRQPVSDVVGVRPERNVFNFNQAAGGLYYSAALDCVVALESEPSRCVVRDVVARELPDAHALARCLPRAERVVWCFSPDGIGAAGEPDPVPAEEGTFMVRGPFAAEGRPFMLPPTARH